MALAGREFAADYERRSCRNLTIWPELPCWKLTEIIEYGLDLEVTEGYKDKVLDSTAVSSR
jgi:hypothetical protein